MEKLDIVKEFNSNLKSRMTNHHLASMYLTLFALLPDEDLRDTLENVMNDYKKSKEEGGWFYLFHKSIRQCDFFIDLSLLQHKNKLTKEQEKERKRLLNKRHKEFDKYCPNHSKEEYDELEKKPHRQKDLMELKKLNTLFHNKDEISRGGIFDCLLWDLIHLDKENELKDILELTFKICNNVKYVKG